jgi:magnesium transporter
MLKHGELFFSPLIAAMAGNVGVQSSVIVQGLANNTLSGSLFNRLVKGIS